MTTIGYIRVSKDDQDVEKQRHLLLEYSQKHKILIDQFIEVEISSRKSQDARRISEVKEILKFGDLLLVAELSRLGRNMLETLNLINEFAERGVKIVFIRQPELSTTGPQAKLLTAIYSYFAEAERDFISVRTKQALAAVKAKGTLLGRRTGSRNKSRPLDPFHGQIEEYLRVGLSISAIMKLINDQLTGPLTYNSYAYFINRDEKLGKQLKESKAKRSFRNEHTGYAIQKTIGDKDIMSDSKNSTPGSDEDLEQIQFSMKLTQKLCFTILELVLQHDEPSNLRQIAQEMGLSENGVVSDLIPELVLSGHLKRNKTNHGTTYSHKSDHQPRLPLPYHVIDKYNEKNLPSELKKYL